MADLVNFGRDLGPPGLVLPVTKMVTSGGDEYAAYYQSAGVADSIQRAAEAEAPLADLQWYTDWQRERASRFIPEDVSLSLSQIREHFQLPRLEDLEGQDYLNAQAGQVQASGNELQKANEYLIVRQAILAYNAVRQGNPNAQPDPIPPQTNVGTLNNLFNNVLNLMNANPNSVSFPMKSLIEVEQTLEGYTGVNINVTATNNNLGSVAAHDAAINAFLNAPGMNAGFYLSEAQRLIAIHNTTADFQSQLDAFQSVILEASYRSGGYGVRPDGQGGFRGTWGIDSEGRLKDYHTDEIRDTRAGVTRFASERTKDVGTDGQQDVPETSESEQVTPGSVMGVGFLGFGRATTPMAQRLADRALYANTQQDATGQTQGIPQEPTSDALQGTANRSASIIVNDPDRNARSSFRKAKAELVKLIGGAEGERTFLTDERIQALLEAFDRVQGRIDAGEFEGQEEINVLDLLARDRELGAGLGETINGGRFGYGQINNLLKGLDAERLESILNAAVEEGSFVRATPESSETPAPESRSAAVDSQTIALLDALDNRDESQFEDFIDELTRKTRRERLATTGTEGPLQTVGDFLARVDTSNTALIDAAQLALEALVPAGSVDALDSFEPPLVPLGDDRLEYDIVTADSLAQRLRREVESRDDLNRPNIVRDVVERLIQADDRLRGFDDPQDAAEIERVVGLIVSQQVLAVAERLTSTALRDAEEQRIRLQEDIARGLEVSDPLGLVSDVINDNGTSLVERRRANVVVSLANKQIDLIEQQTQVIGQIRDSSIERVVEDFDLFSADWESVEVYLREFIMEPGKSLVKAHSIFNQPPKDASGDSEGQLSYQA